MARSGRRVSGNPARRAGRSQASDRPTESVEEFRARLRRDRVLGLSILGLALLVLALNLVMEFASDLQLLPGGHSELYFVGGLLVAGQGAWIAFDLGSNRRNRR